MKADIKRIQEMEAAFDRASAALSRLKAAMEEYTQVQADVEKLNGYYADQWKADYQADEAGKLPSSLKRGVLSEDGLWNFLEENDRIMSAIDDMEG